MEDINRANLDILFFAALLRAEGQTKEIPETSLNVTSTLSSLLCESKWISIMLVL